VTEDIYRTNLGVTIAIISSYSAVFFRGSEFLLLALVITMAWIM